MYFGSLHESANRGRRFRSCCRSCVPAKLPQWRIRPFNVSAMEVSSRDKNLAGPETESDHEEAAFLAERALTAGGDTPNRERDGDVDRP